jgi:hypothetical protein
MSKDQVELHATKLPHIYHADIDETGMLKEIAVVKKTKDGTLYYIDVEPLHPIDKARLKKAVTTQYAAERPLWEILSNITLSNGMNALDFFHSNSVKVKRPKGAKALGGLESISGNIPGAVDKVIGSEFTNPAEAQLDSTTKVFNT